jgi:hypothetical protein
MQLNDNYKTFRESDPLTSRQPVKNKGRLKALVLRSVAEHPGITAGELGDLTGLQLWKRLPELERDRLITRGSPKYYSGTGRYQTSWYLAEERQLTFIEVDNGSWNSNTQTHWRVNRHNKERTTSVPHRGRWWLDARYDYPTLSLGRWCFRYRDEGTKLHEAIESYINTREIDENNLAFTSWLKQFGAKTFLATERFCVNPTLQYGGTIDAISMGQDGELEIWDWKTKDATSFSKYGGSVKDHAQLGAYASALHEMGSQLAPTRGYVAYIMRDGSGVHIDEVDLAKGYNLFLASRNVYTLLKGDK